MHRFLKFILGMKLYMFRTVSLSIIRSFSLYTQQWYMSYRFGDSLLASCQQTCMNNFEYLKPVQKINRNFCIITTSTSSNKYTIICGFSQLQMQFTSAEQTDELRTDVEGSHEVKFISYRTTLLPPI